MKIVRTVRDLRTELAPETHIGFVPTMGAFHEGHLTLMRQSASENRMTVVSLFVNPTQFGEGEDLAKYPRDEERDAELAAKTGVDILFCPSAEEVYPRKTTTVHVAELSDIWEGAARPGHFDGVATVVCKLFNMVQPEVSYFGWKDFQQCAVIRRMVEDLNIPTRLTFVDTVRESDGLAMSSRNAYLSAEHRLLAPQLYKTLVRAAAALRSNSGCSTDQIEQILADARLTLEDQSFALDYFELVDAQSLKAVRKLGNDLRLILAARIGTTRLVDNVVV